MICKALKSYLCSTLDLAGLAAMPFESEQLWFGMNIANRNDARRYLRGLVGEAVYAGRRPQISEATHTAVTLRQISAEHYFPLVGEMDCRESYVEVNVYAKGVDADLRAEKIGGLIRLAVANYYGLWDTVWVHGCTIERDGMQVHDPESGSDNWTFMWSFMLNIVHSQPAAVYPLGQLTAVITARAGTGGTVAMSATGTLVPTGRSLTNVRWKIYEGVTLIRDFGGAPAATVTEATAAGINIECAVSGLPAVIRISCTVTDSAGTTNTAELNYG